MPFPLKAKGSEELLSRSQAWPLAPNTRYHQSMICRPLDNAPFGATVIRYDCAIPGKEAAAENRLALHQHQLLGFPGQQHLTPQLVYVHAWHPGDLVIRYNRSIWHSATGKLSRDDCRVMHLTAFNGKDPPLCNSGSGFETR